MDGRRAWPGTDSANPTKAPRVKLLLQHHLDQLLANGKRHDDDPHFSPWPVVKLFTPDAACTWLVTASDPDEPNRLWALCDIGFGCAEYGTVWLPELLSLRGKLGLPVERDLHFKAKGPISAYIEASYPAGRIIEDIPETAGGQP